jgi:hypothetical protein
MRGFWKIRWSLLKKFKAFPRVETKLYILKFDTLMAYTILLSHLMEENLTYAFRPEPFMTRKGREIF